MWTIIKKEWGIFFGGWMGYLTIMIFLLVSGVLLFFIPDTNLLDGGYATMDSFFEFAPLLLLILIPAITMRSFSDEYKAGTYELLRTVPLKHIYLVGGKFISSVSIVLIALSGTLVYLFTIAYLSLNGIDVGAISGSYIGLILLVFVYTSIGIYISSLFSNALTSFMLTAFACFLLYNVFSYTPSFSVNGINIGYYITIAGVKYHYENISKGYVEWNDIVYFISISFLFLYQTSLHLRFKNN